MKRSSGMVVLVGFLTVFWLFAERAEAHGLGWSVTPGPAIVVKFEYSDGQPMMYGEVSVTAPGGSYEHQKGRSDENGCFAFAPDRTGMWILAANDGQGHITKAEIVVGEADLTGSPSTTASVSGGAHRPGILQVAIGLSVLLNLGLIGLWQNAKKKA